VAPEVPLVPSVSEPAPQAAPSAQPVAAEPVQPEEKGGALAEEQAPVAEQEAAPFAAEAPGAATGATSEEAAPEVAAEEDPFMVVRGETLSGIALNVKPADVSLERMLVAMYRANTDLFAGKNMNRLKTGKIIRIPDAAELEAVQQDEAVKVVRAHVADWNVYRQQLAAVRTTAGEQEGRQESSGKVSAAVAEKVATGKEPAKEVLKLSKGEAPSDKTVGGAKATAKDKANAEEEEAVAKSKALKEAQERTVLLEKNVKDLQRLAELKKQGTPGATSAASAPAAAGAIASASSIPAASSVTAKPKVVPQTKVVTQPSLLDDLLGDPIMLAGAAALLLALGGVGFVLARRGKKAVGGETTKQEQADTAEVGSATGRIAAPVTPSPETGDFTRAASIETAVQSGSEEVDPIGEADLFLTFGRDVQAEEVLKEALKTNPGSTPVKLKLLSIYANRKDTKAFFTYAREIKDSGDESAWNQAAAMGRELEPANPLYGGSGGSESPVVEHKMEAPSVDFDLGFGAPAVAAPTPDFQGKVVMEAPSQEKTTILSADELRGAQESPMDFDVTGTHPGIPALGETVATAPANSDEMMFDVTSTHPGISAMPAPASAESASAGARVDDLIFDLTTTHPGTPAPEASAPAAAAPVADEGLAFTLDFPTNFKVEPASKTEAPVDIGLGDISLNLDSLTSAAASPGGEVKDERWQEVATKLDLAKAYQEMGDTAGAKEILDEVLRDGDEQQRASAQAILQQL